MPKVLILACACCGGPAPALKQWFNQDRGYGLCKRCADEIREMYGNDYLRSGYGDAGIHHSLPG